MSQIIHSPGRRQKENNNNNNSAEVFNVVVDIWFLRSFIHFSHSLLL